MADNESKQHLSLWFNHYHLYVEVIVHDCLLGFRINMFPFLFFLACEGSFSSELTAQRATPDKYPQSRKKFIAFPSLILTLVQTKINAAIHRGSTVR